MIHSAPGNTFRRLAVATLVGLPLAALSLTGCSPAGGGGSAAGVAAGIQTIEPGVQELLTEELHGLLADELPADFEGGDPLRMGTDATVGVPVASFDDNNELIEGFAVDISQAIGWVLGKDVVITHSVWDGLIPGLEAKRFDFTTSIMLDTEKRQEKVDFVDYLVDGSSILAATDSELDNLSAETLCGLGVGVMRGSYEEGLMTEQTESCDKAIDIQIYGGLNEAMLAVKSGRADVMMGAASQLSYVEAMSEGSLRNAGEIVDPGTDGIAVMKGSALAPAIQKAVQELMDNGVYLEILSLYGMESNALTVATFNLNK